MSLDEMQVLLNEYEYFLKRQSVYIGVAEPDTSMRYVYPVKGKQFIAKEVTLIPSFVKVCDEAIVNASDAMQNFTKLGMSLENGRIEFSFDKAKDMVTVLNYSPHSIKIKKEAINEFGDERWMPQTVFTKLHVSSNFVEEGEEKTNHKGGVNGVGSKAITYTSSWFQLELVKDGQFYQQTFTNRCEFSVPSPEGFCDVTEPIIKKAPKGAQDYVKVSFIPDPLAFKKPVGAKLLDDDTVSFLRKRCYDVVLMNPGVEIWLDGVCLTNKKTGQPSGINGYFNMFGYNTKSMLHFSKEFERKTGKNKSNMTNKIDYYVFDTLNDGVNFQLLLNGLSVKESSLYGNLMGDLASYILEKSGKDHTSTSHKNLINRYLSVVCIAQINNIDFTGQTKDNFKYSPVKFDFKFEDYLPIIKKMNIWKICTMIADNDDLAKYEKKHKNMSTTGIKTYKKCEMSGKKVKNGEKLTLILIEGKSAMATIKDGLSKEQARYHSIYALKGKPINVVGNPLEMVFENKEFLEMMAILGLTIVKDKAENRKKNAIANLNYGGVCIMSDQDSDGAHIRGLLVNMFNFFWPHLVEDGFLTVIRTPIVKIYVKGNVAGVGPDGKPVKREKTATAKVCYTLKDYNEFLANPGKINTNTMIVKYIKGLGSLNTVDAAEVFRNYNTYTLFKDTDADESLKLVFAKDMADARKDWICYAEEGDELDADTDEIFVSDLIDTEVKAYSRYNTSRALPNVNDGLKISQRKILDTCFQDNRFTRPGIETKKIIKVSQLGGLVSTRTGYIHGEDSLFKAITGMAQNFAGSNNLNPLLPFGQVGTRIGGIKEAAAPRYVFTAANFIMQKIFRKEDYPIQKRLVDDGDEIEPINMIPIIPYLLVNGSTGIGSGYSCNIPQYHPIDVVDKLIDRIHGDIPEDLTPWFRYSECHCRYYDPNPEGVTSVDEDYKSPTIYQYGKFTIEDNVITVTDVPTGFLYNKLEEYYEKICEKQIVAKAKKAATKAAKAAKADGDDADQADKEKYLAPEEIILSSFVMHYDTVSCNIVLELKADYATILNGEDEGQKVALLRKLKLVDTKNMTFSNAHALTSDGTIVKLRGTSHVIELFYKYRLEQYKIRKAHWTDVMMKEIKLKKNIEKFIRAVRSEKIKVGKDLDMPAVLAYLRKEGFTRYNRKGVELPDGAQDEPEEEEVEDDFGVVTKIKTASADKDTDPGYNYLLSIPFRSLTTSRADKLVSEINDLDAKLEAYTNYKIKDIWLDELEELRVDLLGYNEPIKRAASATSKKSTETIEERYPFWFSE